MEFVIPSRLTAQDENSLHSLEPSEGEDERDLMVVCSGDLVEQTVHPDDPTKKVFIYALPMPTPAQYVSFAIGPFSMVRLSRNQESLQQYTSAEDAELEDSGAEILAFHLPGYSADVEYTCSMMQDAMDIYVKDFGSYPFSVYRLVFVDEAAFSVLTSAGMTICSTRFLCAPDVVDQMHDTARILANALATQWSGVNIIPKAWSDVWLTTGLAGYMSGIFVKQYFGTNEYKYRMKKDMDRVVAMDTNRPPLYNVNAFLPMDAVDLEFVNCKAPLVICSLDKRLCKSGVSLGLSRIIPKIFLSAITGEMNNNALGTHAFLRMCRKVSGTDPKQFADQWIYGSGCPKFHMTHHFNRKKMMVEIKVTQETTNGPASSSGAPPGMEEDHLPTRLFTGPMTVRIHEADGTPYEHVIDIQEPLRQFEVQFNTKYKRIRRNTKRFQARQAAAQAAAEEDGDAVDMLEFGYEMHIFEDEQERELWKVSDWTEEDEQRLSSAAYEWIRMDADSEWICGLSFEQPDFMWVSEVTKDRDVLGQYEAVSALSRQPSLIASSVLAKVLLNPQYFYRIRIMAAAALAKCAIEKLNWIGLFHLLKAFQSLYCFDDPSSKTATDAASIACIPRGNNWTDVAEYFVQMGIAAAVSQVRDVHGAGHPIAKHFLLDLLRYNENSGNPYSDSFYIANLMACLTAILLPSAAPNMAFNMTEDLEAGTMVQAAYAELDRYQTLDRLLPSFHNIVTAAVLQCKMRLMISNLIATEFKPFLVHSRDGNFSTVRLMAFDCLLVMRGIQHPMIAPYLMQVATSDPSPQVRTHVARGISRSLGLIMSSGDVSFGTQDEMIVEEDGAMLSERRGITRGEFDIAESVRVLRKDFQDKWWLQDVITASIVNDKLDYRVRRELFIIAELLYKPAEGTLPKLVIKMPVRPTAETLREETPTTANRIKFVLSPQQTPEAASAPSSKKSKKKESKKAKPAATVNRNEWVKACRKMLRRLVSAKASYFFRLPVDPVRDRCPTYLEEIKEPMDLSTMKAKLDIKQYQSPVEFEADFRLMLRNCYSFNPQGSQPYTDAQELEVLFEKEWPKMMGELQAAKLEETNITINEMPSPPPPPQERGGTIQVAPIIKKQKGRAKEKAPSGRIPTVSNGMMDVSQVVQPTGHPGYHPTRNKRIQKKLYENPNCIIFARPVDPIADGCPTYFEEIAEPMDLGTIGTKLSRGQYTTDDQFIRDVKLVVANCHQFNPTGWLYDIASELDRLFEREWLDEEAKEEKKQRGEELRRVNGFVKKLQADPKWYIFHEPVDPVAFPQYRTIISQPVDFKSIKEKLDKDAYAKGQPHSAILDDFEADFRLLLANCFTFNAQPDSYGHLVGKELETVFNRAIKDLRSQSRKASGPATPAKSSKRKDEEQADGSIKKIRLT